MHTWQLQDAKARLSEVVKKAEQEGPQGITVHGRSTAVVVSTRDYDRLRRPRGNFVEFMRESPLCGTELEVKRNKTKTRKTIL